ncbi:hypothetical protein Q8A67_006329 [Cirrhinus molitorella]|uniref:Ig-like domain-containing protein n=1 Tax=Cirrhinus molitorella TaxID=172907 RepID=A0AA88TUK6_9TELE|nr:hypothetical protein Q8A67_006329 [Cirrhinus molitorella]
MFDIFIFFLILCNLSGVFGGDAVQSESVMEGESVTLQADVNTVKTDDLIQWRFGNNKDILIAQINRQSGKRKFYDVKFKGRLQLDDQTGSLTITDTRTTDSGLYEVKNNNNKQILNTFNLTVYARLSVPVISHSSLNSSSSEQNCSLLCSAVNVGDVSLSWYKGHSLLSSISASDLSINLSLPLDIECLDDSYSCVINNPIRNQTTQLNTQLCKKCAVQTRDREITYADPTFYKRHQSRVKQQDDVVYAGVVRR